MPTRTPYLALRPQSSRYWFRRSLPHAWRHLLDKHEINFSLQTANKREAQRRCRLSAGLIEVFFDETEQLVDSVEIEQWKIAKQLKALLIEKLDTIKQALAASSVANTERVKALMKASLLKQLQAAKEGPELFISPEMEAEPISVASSSIAVEESVAVSSIEVQAEPNQWKKYLAYWKEQRDPRLKTYGETVKVIERWTAFSKNKPLALVTMKDVNRWVSHLRGVPLQSSSIKRYISLVRAVINVAIRGELIRHKINPFQEVDIPVSKRLDGQEKRLPFSEAHLNALFSSPIYRSQEKGFPAKGGDEAAFWIPLILFTTGARLEEIGQLYIDDITHRQDRYWFSINDSREYQVLKNQSSRREIPIHKELLRIGFIAYVNRLKAQGEERLFPKLKPNKYSQLTRTFSTWCNEYIDKYVVDDRRFCVHSFRHNYQDFGIEYEIQRDVLDALTGHAQAGMGAHYGMKRGGVRVFPDRVLIHAVDKLRFGKVDLSHLYVDDWERLTLD